MFLGDPNYPIVPYKAVLYLVGECNYGGRVTDDKDRRCILETLSDFYTEDIQVRCPMGRRRRWSSFSRGYSSASVERATVVTVVRGGCAAAARRLQVLAVGHLFAPSTGPLSTYKEYIRSLPFIESPEVFGLHENADISSAMLETLLPLMTSLSLQVRAPCCALCVVERAVVEWSVRLGVVVAMSIELTDTRCGGACLCSRSPRAARARAGTSS
jgi:hypothetical protein